MKKVVKKFVYPEDAKLMIDAGIIPNAPQGIIQGFFEFCNQNSLSPWNKDAYILEYWNTSSGGKDFSFITSYHELFKVAAKSGDYAGVDAVVYNERRVDGQLVYNTMAEVIASKKMPVTAHVTVYKIIGGQRFPFRHQINCAEYIKTKKDGTPYGSWKNLLFTMLEKVVMSRAIKLTWPIETDGFRTEEEVSALTGETDAAEEATSTTKVVAPKGAKEEKKAIFPDTDKEASEKAELLEMITEAVNECENEQDLNVVYKNNAHWIGKDQAILTLFKDRKAAIIKADNERNAQA